MTDDEQVALRETDKPKKTSKEEQEDLKDVATNTILLCLTNNTLHQILSLTDLVDIWDKLKSRYKLKLLTKLVTLEEMIVWYPNG